MQNTEDLAILREDIEEISKAFSTIDAEIIKMKIQGYTIREIKKKLNVGQGRIKNVLNRYKSGLNLLYK